MEEDRDFGWEDEDRAPGWEYWYSAGIKGFNSERVKKQKESARLDWDRPSLEERRILKKLRRKKKLMLKEIKVGVKWVCKELGCDAIYFVKTPFSKLYCSACLAELKSNRILPVDEKKLGYWILEEA